jgi:hypothetical protein
LEFKYILLLTLISLAIGYFGGRYVGYKEGLKEGRNSTPLALRKESLEEGVCVLCNEKFELDAKDS